MRSEYKKAVLDAYQKKKSEGPISINLLGLSPGQFRDECIKVYKERPSDEDEEILRIFFGARENASSYTEIIENVDIDKFRPVKSFILGRTTRPELKVVELLAWLIDFKLRPYPVWLTNSDNRPPVDPRKKRSFTIPKTILTLTLFVILSFGAYAYWERESTEIHSPSETQEKCMHWTGNRYEPISCNTQSSNTPVTAINFQKLNRFKKINISDKLTKYDLGKVWYAKRYGKVEFFTDSGMHPVDTNRTLKPLTDYMLNIHTSYYRYLFNCILWLISIAVVSIILGSVFFKYLPKVGKS